MNYDSRGGVSAAFSYPRAKASTSFPDVLNLLKRSKLIELIVKNTYLKLIPHSRTSKISLKNKKLAKNINIAMPYLTASFF